MTGNLLILCILSSCRQQQAQERIIIMVTGVCRKVRLVSTTEPMMWRSLCCQRPTWQVMRESRKTLSMLVRTSLLTERQSSLLVTITSSTSLRKHLVWKTELHGKTLLLIYSSPSTVLPPTTPILRCGLKQVLTQVLRNLITSWRWLKA